jgi:hypothetical protein
VRRPLSLLVLLLICSLAARAAWIGDPCHSPCRSAADRTLVFDEVYYVNAARRIAGITVPGMAEYARTPAGKDPNAEHPQLAKLVIAGAIELFGDGPFAWRIGSLLFGAIAILGMFLLVRAAGGGDRLALGAATLMAADNLLLVAGRIGTLDVYVVAMMILGVTAYLRGRPLLAGVLLGVGAAFKLVAPYALVVLALLEAGRELQRGRAAMRLGRTAQRLGHVTLGPDATRRMRAVIVPRARRQAGATLAAAGRRLAVTAGASAITLLGLLELMDLIAPPYDTARRSAIGGGPLGHLGHILAFAGKQVSRHGPHGIASYPWQWWADYKPIVYLNVNPAQPAPGLSHLHPAVHFLGVVSPPILILALPALWFAARAVIRRADAAGLDLLALAWCAGTWVPFELASALLHRTSYLYYMVIVMPGVYVAVARLVATLGPPRWAFRTWVAAVAAAAVLMYPLTPLP